MVFGVLVLAFSLLGIRSSKLHTISKVGKLTKHDKTTQTVHGIQSSCLALAAVLSRVHAQETDHGLVCTHGCMKPAYGLSMLAVHSMLGQHLGSRLVTSKFLSVAVGGAPLPLPLPCMYCA